MKAAIVAAIMGWVSVSAAHAQPADAQPAEDAWSPPANVDPQSILREATDDARAGKFDRALAKHVWFHEHALEIQPSLVGVRLSFALSYWMDLGAKHPPALAKLKEIRDATRKRVVEAADEPPRFEDFQDLNGINRALGEPADTAGAFRIVAEKYPALAERTFRVAQPALIAAKEYKLYAEHIKPDQTVAEMVRSYRTMREVITRVPNGADMVGRIEQRYINEAATLVAVLINGDRLEDAADAVAVLRREEGDAEFQASLANAMDAALRGEMPAATE
jgi:hypothetical protein